MVKMINTGEVTRAAHPNFAGMTPDYGQSPSIKMRGRLTDKNDKANQSDQLNLTQGTYRSPQPFKIDPKNKRKIDPLEYRGPNLSDCMYHTFTSFKDGRKNVSPRK